MRTGIGAQNWVAWALKAAMADTHVSACLLARAGEATSPYAVRSELSDQVCVGCMPMGDANAEMHRYWDAKGTQLANNL